MHNPLTRPQWLQELNDELGRLGVRMSFMFDRDFVLVEEDYLNGEHTDDVARRIAEDTHPRISGFKVERATAQS